MSLVMNVCQRIQVIRPAALTVQNGSFTTLLGPFGRGKASLLRL